jgi:Flp pilus assembly pilin Flp
MVAKSGAVAAEYTFLIAFISILAAIGMVVLGDDLQQYFQGLATAIDAAATPTPDEFAT